MLDQLFGSKTRVSLLRLFIDNPERAFFVRELTREIDAQINSVRRELGNLVDLDIVRILDEPPVQTVKEWEDAPKGLNKKKFYQLNQSFVLHKEIVSLFTRSHLMLEKDLMKQLANIGNVYLLIMTGAFTNFEESATDLLLVGHVNKTDLVQIIQQFEQKLGKEINYTIMPMKEFEYRRDITDKFLYDILVGPKIVVVDKVGITQLENKEQ